MDHDDDWILFRLQRLDPGRFEELCCALLTAEGHDVRHVGATGADGGVDIATESPDGERWVIQCKRYKSIGPSQAGPEITKVIETPPNPRPSHYRLVATCNVSRAVDEELEERATKAEFPLEVGSSWDATKLTGLLRDTHTNLREQFIEPREPSFRSRNRFPRPIEDGLTVLIFDDEPSVGHDLGDYFMDEGISVFLLDYVPDPEMLKYLIERHSPLLGIILDVSMSFGASDGIEAYRDLRRIGYKEKIVFYTKYAMSAPFVEQMISAGAKHGDIVAKTEIATDFALLLKKLREAR